MLEASNQHHCLCLGAGRQGSMRMDIFGDSYHNVKKSLLRWLKRFGDWSVHPMFTEKGSG